MQPQKSAPHRVGEFDFHGLRPTSGCPCPTPLSAVIIFTIMGDHQIRSFARRRSVRTTCSDASIATYAVSPTDLNRHLREIISELSGLIYVPIRLRQALGFAERGCTPQPARFLGPSAPNPMKRRGFWASPQAGVGGSPQSTAHLAPILR